MSYLRPLYFERYTYRYTNTIARLICTPFLTMTNTVRTNAIAQETKMKALIRDYGC